MIYETSTQSSWNTYLNYSMEVSPRCTCLILFASEYQSLEQTLSYIRIRKIVAIVKKSILHLYCITYRFTFSFILSQQIRAKCFYDDQNVLWQNITSSMFKIGKGHIKNSPWKYSFLGNQNAHWNLEVYLFLCKQKEFCCPPEDPGSMAKTPRAISATPLAKFDIIGASLW